MLKKWDLCEFVEQIRFNERFRRIFCWLGKLFYFFEYLTRWLVCIVLLLFQKLWNSDLLLFILGLSVYICFLFLCIVYGLCNNGQLVVFYSFITLLRCLCLPIFNFFLFSLHKMMFNYQTLLLFQSIYLFYSANLWFYTLLYLYFVDRHMILLLSLRFYKFSHFCTADIFFFIIGITILFYLIICLIFMYYFRYLKQLQHIN